MTPPAAGVAADRTARRRRAPAARRVARPAVAPRLPRRVSGPGRPARRTRRRTRGDALVQRLLVPFLERVRALPDAPVVDRLVRGRAWIVLIGFLLMGMVAMQVSLLKLNASMGRAVQQSGNLERRNGELRATLSRLSAGQRVQLSGARLGMFMPDAGQVHFLSLRQGRDSRRAASALRANRVGAAGNPVPAPVAPSAAPDQVSATADPPSSQAQSGAADSTSGGTSSTGPSDASGGGTVAQGSPASPPADAASTGGAQPPASG